VKNWFQAFAFHKWVKLYRYSAFTKLTQPVSEVTVRLDAQSYLLAKHGGAAIHRALSGETTACPTGCPTGATRVGGRYTTGSLRV
jgi:hypothetical protein